MESSWRTLCSLDELVPDVGVRALVNGNQVAVFRLSETDEVYAVDAYDPFSNANVISRGIIGDLKGRLVVASPIYKQHFDLTNGECLEDESVKLTTYPVRVIDNLVQVAG